MKNHRDWYGQIKTDGTMINAHRAAYEAYHGPIPDGLHVLHKCHLKSCVNPAHLYVGTHLDNMADLFRAGYRNTAKGERVGSYRYGKYVGKKRPRKYPT